MDGALTPLFLFPTYTSREDALKSGIPESVVPPFDPNKPRKCWFDPNPPNPDDEGNVVYSGVAHTLLGSVKLGTDGKPYYTKIRLTPLQAKTMNLASEQPPVPPNIGEIPMPCRSLQSDEEFVPNMFGGTWKVAKKALVSTPTPQTGNDYSARFDRIDAQLAAIIDELKNK